MKQLKCEMCGSTDLMKQDGVFVCQYCGAKYSVEEAKKMMVEVEGTVDVKGTVKVDQSNRTQNFYQLARMDIDKKGCGNAQRYYEGVLLEEPTSWEAQFFVEYIKCWNANTTELRSSSIAFSNCLDSILNLIKTCVDDIDEQRKALETLCDRSEKIFDRLVSSAKDIYTEESNVQPYIPSYKPSFSDLYDARCEKVNAERAAHTELYKDYLAFFPILTKLGDGIETVFANSEELKRYALKPWEKFVVNFKTFAKETGVPSATVKLGEYIAKIKKYDTTYVADDLPESTRLEIENALKNNNMILAIKRYQEFSGKGLAEAKSYIEEFALLNGIVVESKQLKNVNEGGAEAKIKFCGTMGLTPFTFFVGICALCFKKKAEEENGGSLSKRATGWLITGVVGFFFWLFVYMLMFSSIS